MDTNNHGSSSRSMDAMARKKEEDRQRQIKLQKDMMELREMGLKTQEDKHLALRREIIKLESQGADLERKTGPVINLERAKNTKIAELNKKIADLESAVQNKGKYVVSQTKQIVEGVRSKLLSLISQNEAKDRDLLAKIKSEQEEEKKLRQEIDKLKKEESSGVQDHPEIEDLTKQNASLINSNKTEIDKIKAQIAFINQDFEREKKASTDALNQHKIKLEGKHAEAILAVNRINALNQEIGMFKAKIADLERKII